MKRWIHASIDDDYVRNTDRDKINFDHDVIWSIQFYNNTSVGYEEEVFILARTYNQALEQANVLCDCLGYPKDECVVQYAFDSISKWDRLEKSTCNGVTYGY